MHQDGFNTSKRVIGGSLISVIDQFTGMLAVVNAGRSEYREGFFFKCPDNTIRSQHIFI